MESWKNVTWPDLFYFVHKLASCIPIICAPLDFFFFLDLILSHICLCTTRMSGADEGQSRVSGPSEPELQMVVSLCVTVGN